MQFLTDAAAQIGRTYSWFTWLVPHWLQSRPARQRDGDVDYSVPVDAVRAQLREIVKDDPTGDGKVAGVQMTELPENMVQLRLLVSARGSGLLFDLCCAVHEQIRGWLLREYP